MTIVRKVIFVFFIIGSVSFIETYRILSIFPFNSKSHNIIFNTLITGLLKRGHQVDHITHYPMKNQPANYKVVVNLNGTVENVENNVTIEFATELGYNPVKFIANLHGNDLCELMSLEVMQKFIKNIPNNQPYDLVMTEAFGAHCYMGFGHYLKVPVVAVCSSLEYPWINYFTGNNDNLAAVRNALTNNFNRLKFWSRLKNIYTYYRNVFIFNIETYDKQTKAMRKYLSPDIPNIRDVEKSVALTIINSHPVIYGPRPVTSSLIEIGGFHIDEEKLSTLPPGLKKWLDESTSGFVYFSFGSLVVIETLPVSIMKDLYKCFRAIAPTRVLMKILEPKNLPPGLPKNVLTSPWIPQQAVLAHPNVRVFMTHGGMLGSEEALYFGVPMIGIPLFGDQARNVDTFVDKKMTIKIYFKDLTYASLYHALNETLINPKYRDQAKFYSKLFRDKPLNAMNTSIFWIEYVIRNGPSSLRSPALELLWWQLLLLDVFGFIFVCLTTIFFLIYKIMNLLLKKRLSLKKMKNQ